MKIFKPFTLVLTLLLTLLILTPQLNYAEDDIPETFSVTDSE